MKRRVLFVGTNPTRAAATTEAFSLETKSGRLVHQWIRDVEVEPYFINVLNRHTENNASLRAEHIQAGAEKLKVACQYFEKVVGLGLTAQKALQRAKVPHLAFPHPSGLNRQWNCPRFTEQKLRELREYLEG